MTAFVAALKMRRTAEVGAAIAFLLSTGCGSAIYTTSPAPSPTSLLDPNQPRADKPDVTILSTGLNPQVLHVNAPVTVTFTNSDSVPHTLRTADLGFDLCPEMNAFGTLSPGQSGSVGFSESDAVCTYAEATDPGNKKFQGYIAIHPAS